MDRSLAAARPFPPALGRATFVDTEHRDGSRRWANKSTEIAAYALFLDHVGIAFSVNFVKLETLMSPVFTRDITKITANTVLIVDMCFYIIVKVEVSPIGHPIHRFADDVVDRCKAFVVEVLVQAIDHVLNNAVAVMHHGRADLDIARA